jgi:hypothetical protein
MWNGDVALKPQPDADRSLLEGFSDRIKHSPFKTRDSNIGPRPTRRFKFSDRLAAGSEIRGTRVEKA